MFFYVDNEWKTRFETQQEMNDQLEKQVILLRDKLGQLKIPSRDGKLTTAFSSVSCSKPPAGFILGQKVPGILLWHFQDFTRYITIG